MERRTLQPSLLAGRSYLIVGGQDQTENLVAQFPVVDRLVFDATEGDVKGLRAIIAQAQLGAVSKQRLLLIINAQLLSEILQNTLLKLLEEPPSTLVIILQAKQDNEFLPTVLSRVHRLSSTTARSISGQSIFGQSPGGLFEHLTDQPREQLVELLTMELGLVRRELLSEPSLNITRRVLLLDRAVKKLAQNCNQKLTVDWLLLQWYGQSGYMSN